MAPPAAWISTLPADDNCPDTLLAPRLTRGCGAFDFHQMEAPMAKEQKRGNREQKKPKKKKETIVAPVLPARDAPPPATKPKKKG